MEWRAALLLVLLIGTASAHQQGTSTTKENAHHKDEKIETTSTSTVKEAKTTTEELFSMKDVDYKKLLDPKETLLEEIRTLDEEISTDKVSHFSIPNFYIKLNKSLKRIKFSFFVSKYIFHYSLLSLLLIYYFYFSIFYYLSLSLLFSISSIGKFFSTK